MRPSGILLGYFDDIEDAREVMRQLLGKQLRRIALIHRNANGGVQVYDLFRRDQVFGGLAGVVLGGVVAALWVVGYGQTVGQQLALKAMWPVGIGVLLGGLIGWVSVRFTQMGVDRGLIRRHSGWLIPEETVLILQLSSRHMGKAIRILRRSGEPQPMIYSIHPEREFHRREMAAKAVPLATPQLQLQARTLSRQHELAPRRGRRGLLFERLDEVKTVLDQVSRDLGEADELERSVSISAEWILDNAYIVRSHIRDVETNLSRKFYLELPVLAGGDLKGHPRVYELATELVRLTDGRLDEENIQAFVTAYQEGAWLTIGELWALPLMLRIALIERLQRLIEQVDRRLREHELADFWANRLLATSRNQPDHLFQALADLAQDQGDPSSFFASHLIGHLYDEEAALVPVQSWLERRLKRPLADLPREEQARQAGSQISIGNAITSLRELSLLDWRDVFERESRVEGILRRDPAGTYARMDFDTRDRYRQAVEEVGRHAETPEWTVADHLISLAEGHGQDPRRGHVGYYLIGAGRPELLGALGCPETGKYRVFGWVYRHHTGLYLSSIGVLTGAILVMLLGISSALESQSFWTLSALSILALFPSSQLALSMINYLVTRTLPPRKLPKMSFEREGIPTQARTLVVVPILLLNENSVREEIEKLEIRYLANPEQNLLFSLFGDFVDAPEMHMPSDETLREAAEQGIRALNERYPGDRFFYFHRPRDWSETEGRYIGWERKRGKLAELNALLEAGGGQESADILRVGKAGLLSEVHFVITLDSDTQLPPNTARRMIETIAHPLNRPVFDENGRLVEGTYTIIQPRVSTALPSATATPFSRLFTDPVGTDPYTQAVSDVYQDLAGEGSYIGKGIYDVRAFQQMLADRFPEELLLSHDLIEGAHVRVALATDIELFDEFPPDYMGYARRQHRWIRGDWQISEWVTPWVPGPDGKTARNPLSLLNRWKILDNLRRSLVEPASLLLLLLAWFQSAVQGTVFGAFIALLVLFQPLTHPVTWATTATGLRRISYRELGHALLRAVVEAALIPYQAGLALDAIVRVWYRRLVSGKHLLEWTASQMARWQQAHRIRPFIAHMGITSGFTLLAWIALFWGRPSSALVAGPFLLLWFISPGLGFLLSRRNPVRRPQEELRDKERSRVREIARRTWRYFDEFVGPESSWLPPDNYQVSHQDRIARRTSPTNIGLWLLSVLSASDFGYLNPAQVLERIQHTMDTLERLQKFQGHLLNWYEMRDLRPLEPRYVSAVDSGNFLASLWALEGGLRQLESTPALGSRSLNGIKDTLQVLGRTLSQEGAHEPWRGRIREISQFLADRPDSPADIVAKLRAVGPMAGTLARDLLAPGKGRYEAGYWAAQIERQCEAWLSLVDRLFPWLERLSDLLLTARDRGGMTTAEVQTAFRRLPLSLDDLAHEPDVPIDRLEAVFASSGALDDPIHAELEACRRARAESRQAALEMLETIDRLVARGASIAQRIDMSFLYDRKRRLFAIGYNVSQGRLDNSYYDLLASEARLGSFISIARGDVPIEHWLALNRPFGAVGRRRALLSWTGTMFEYLMPTLLQRTYENSLLDNAVRQAVRVQIRYARRRGVPWGISESAYGDLDPNKTYQYKAFGVPELGLKRGLEEDLVVAPYATFLALSINPRDALHNLSALSELGLESRYGYYEAIDFGRASRRPGEKGVIVRAYMAHHQAMALIAMDNLLHRGIMRRRFHADPRVQATEALLYERIPVSPPLYHIPSREQPRAPAEAFGIAPSESKFDTPHTANPKAQLLANGSYSLMITGAGGGYSRWRDFDITRWRADTTRDHWGTFCYLRDLDSGDLWSAAYHPTGVESKEYEVVLAIDRAEIARTDYGVGTHTEVVVSPEDDVEIRRITLSNRSIRSRRIEVISYAELAMSPHGADLQHPAFNKFFVETEAVEELGALIAWRHNKSPEDPPIFTGHMLNFEGQPPAIMDYETDRSRFIGRGRSLKAPAALRDGLTNSHGFVLDPIFSLRRVITLRPGQQVRFSMLLGAAETREGLLDLLTKYQDTYAIERAFELQWAHTQLELRQLRIQPDDARRFQKMASFMVYPHHQFRPSGERLSQNKLGQSDLWPYGISGDLPIALVSIGEERDLTLVRQMLQAHTYWREHGLRADLVVLNEETSAYEQPLHEKLTKMIQAHSVYTGIDEPGGVYLRVADQIPEQDLTLLLSVARINLVAARGSLAQQLITPREDLDLPEELPSRRISEEPSARLSFVELAQYNGLGGFTQGGREYVIYLGPERQTPAPWVNVIANPDFGTLVSESGAGFTWCGNSQQNRLTPWTNDPMRDPACEAIYIRDEESGEIWTPTPAPLREREAYRIRHGAGYSIFEHNSHAIEQELLTFVPVNDKGGEPLRLQRLRLRNDSRRRRRLSVTFYAEWVLGEDREATQMHVVTRWDAESRILTAQNKYHPEYGDRVAFAGISPPSDDYTADRTAFLGRNGDLMKPAAMSRIALSGRTGADLDPCAALRTELELAPGQEKEIIVLLGQAESAERAGALSDEYRQNHMLERAYIETREWWDHLLESVEVTLPEERLNLTLNRWALYQNLSCRIWGRTGLYQSGGAFGFRDQLQDVLAMLYSRPDVARQHILRAAGRQFSEGDVQHWWHPTSGAGVRTRISDDLLWLPYAVERYVSVTGDEEILHQPVRFLEGPPLGEDEQEAYFIPEASPQLASLYEHCQRAIARASSVGPHGLPLIGGGDWNDGMNRVGVGGRGESVWLAWFLLHVLRRFANLADRFGEPGQAQAYRNRAEGMAAAIEDSSWDGAWYRRAFFDDGTPLGSAQSQEAQIDLLPQSWAVISGAGEPARRSQSLYSAWERLVLPDENLILLFAPPFDETELDPGYIRAYPPGVRENGGQYTHAAIWLADAFARNGDGERAVALLRMIDPIGHAADPESADVYQVEPYVLAADIYHLRGRSGMGGWTWYTGSAGWYYRTWLEEILGLKLHGEELRIEPVIPPTWDGFSLRYRHGEGIYEIKVENPDGVGCGVKWITLDGRRLDSLAVPLERERTKHRVVVRMG